MQYNACNTAYAIWHMQYSPWRVQRLQRLVTGSTQMPFVYPQYVRRVFLSILSYAGKLGFGVTEIQLGWPFGFAGTREGWKIYWSPGSFETLYPGFCETWVKNKGFDVQSHSSLTDVHLTCTLHTSVMSTAPVFLFLSANSWSCLMPTPWLLALYKRMQGMDYLLCSSRWNPPAPLLQTKWAPFHQYFLLAFDKDWGPVIERDVWAYWKHAFLLAAPDICNYYLILLVPLRPISNHKSAPEEEKPRTCNFGFRWVYPV